MAAMALFKAALWVFLSVEFFAVSAVSFLDIYLVFAKVAFASAVPPFNSPMSFPSCSFRVSDSASVLGRLPQACFNFPLGSVALAQCPGRSFTGSLEACVNVVAKRYTITTLTHKETQTMSVQLQRGGIETRDPMSSIGGPPPNNQCMPNANAMELIYPAAKLY